MNLCSEAGMQILSPSILNNLLYLLLSRFFPLVDEDLCPVESGRGVPGDLHQEPTSAV